MFIDEREKKREKALDFQGTTGEKEDIENFDDIPDLDDYCDLRKFELYCSGRALLRLHLSYFQTVCS